MTRQLSKYRQLSGGTSGALTPWAGALGWTVTSQALATQWNSFSRAGTDVMTVTLNAFSPTVTTYLTPGANQVKAGTLIRPAFQLSGSGGSPVTQITTSGSTSGSGTLGDADAMLQALDGAVAEWVIYGDDAYTGTVAQHITNLQTNVDTVHNFTRANGAPAFKVIYIPSGTFLQSNLAANSILATYADAVLFQAQPFEDQPNGADPTFVSTCQTMMSLLRSYAPTHPAALQVQVYSKSNGATVWTPAKVIADINASGSVSSPTWIAISFADAQNSTGATTCFNSVLANYRP